MAEEMNVLDITCKCTTDLSGSQYLYVALSADNTVIVADASTHAKAIGILQNKPKYTAGQTSTARVRVLGISRVIACSAGLAIETLSGPDTNGTAISKAADGNYYNGICLEAAAAGGLATVLLTGIAMRGA